MKKLSFLERLTGSQSEDYDRVLDEDHTFGVDDKPTITTDDKDEDYWEEESPSGGSQDGELPVDMYQTEDYIVIRTLVAGVSPQELEISLTRDMVTIRGIREEYQEIHDDGYFHRELFWGSFSRTLLLPEEVAIDEAEAQEKHGLLEIKLPKLDKHRSAQLKVRTNSQQK